MGEPNSMMDDKLHGTKPAFSTYQAGVEGDEKLQPRWQHNPTSHRDRPLRRLCVYVCIILATCTLMRSLLPYVLESCGADHQRGRITGNNDLQTKTGGKSTRKVSLEAHVMSKCPDAKACLQELVVPAMEKVSDKVDFELSFIGR
jgi:hypothetical protein